MPDLSVGGTAAWPVANGEMADRVRTFDWSATPLGPPAAWPQSLRTVVDLVLASHQPAYLAWGPELASIYNDAFVPILGDKHPGALGLPFRDLWSEVWEEYRPLVAATLAGEALHFVDRPVPLAGRAGRPLGYFTFSWTPIRDEAGAVAGFFATVTETTERVLAEEARLRLALDVARLGTWSWDLVTGEGELDPRGAEIVGLPPGPLGDVRAAQLAAIHPDDFDRVMSTIAAGVAGGTDFDLDYRVVRPDGSVGHVASRARVVAGDDGRPLRLIGTNRDATAEREASAAVRESEARFRLVADAVPQIVWITDAEGRTEFFNRQWTAYTGRPYEPTTAAEVAATAVHPDDAAPTMARFDEARRTGGVFEVEHRIRSAAGDYRWFLVRAEPYRDAATGEVVRWYGASTDIHERKLAEARQAFLLALDDRLRPLADPDAVRFEAARALAAHLGADRAGYAEDRGDGETVEVVRAFADAAPPLDGVFRYDDYGPELLRAFRAGRTVVRPDVANDPSLTDAEKAAHAALGLAATVNVPLLKNGRLVAVFFVHHARPCPYAAEEVALVEAVAERTWEAVGRARAEAALARERALLAAVLRQLPVGVIIAEAPSGRLLLGNDEVDRIWRHPFVAAASVGEYAAYQGFHPDDRPYAPEDWPLARAVAGETVRREEIRFRRGDGSFGWMEVGAAPVPAEGGGVAAAVVVFADVTERKEAERRREEFVALATHELRTPVTSIKGYAQLLRNRFRKAGDERAAATMATLDEQVDRLQALVADLVEAARVDAGQLRLDLAPFDLDALVDEQVAELQMTSDRHRLAREGRAGVGVVGDRGRLGQVLANLLANAIKYSPDGGDVVVATDADPGGVTLCVRDRGIGIPAGELERVFDRFYRSAGGHAAAPAGLGLGLAISAEIVRRHGGRIWAESAEGEGSTFCFRLPLGRAGDE